MKCIYIWNTFWIGLVYINSQIFQLTALSWLFCLCNSYPVNWIGGFLFANNSTTIAIDNHSFEVAFCKSGFSICTLSTAWNLDTKLRCIIICCRTDKRWSLCSIDDLGCWIFTDFYLFNCRGDICWPMETKTNYDLVWDFKCYFSFHCINYIVFRKLACSLFCYVDFLNFISILATIWHETF